MNVEDAQPSSSPLLVDDARPDRSRDDRRDWWAWSADGAFALFVVATIVCYLVKANGLGFFADDWRLAQRGGSIGDYFQPYNDSLNVVPIAVYRSLYAVFGFHTAVPLRVLGVVSGAMVAVAMFLVVRARVGSVPALVVGATLLWYPDFLVIPAAFDHYLALSAMILCAWLLSRDGIVADVSLALAFAFALCTAGLAVAGGVGLVTLVVLARAPRSRWIAVLVPLAAWTTWWLLASDTTRGRGEHSPAHVIEFVVDGIAASFRGLVFDNRVLAVLLGIAFVLTLCWRMRQGVRACRSEIAWTVALVAWWVGVAYSRGVVAGSDVVRYNLIGSTFLVLAFLPTLPTRRTTRRSFDGPVGLVGGVALALLVVVLNHGAIFDNQQGLARAFRQVRITTIIGNLDPAVVPDDVPLQLGGRATVSAREYRRLVAEYGAPPGSRANDVDASIVALGDVRPVAAANAASARCLPLTRPVPVTEPAVTLRAGARDATVRLRRFEAGFTEIGTIAAHSTATVGLPGPVGGPPWIIDAPGACRVADVRVVMRHPRPQARIADSTALVVETSGTVVVAAVDFRLRRDDVPDVTTFRATRSLVGWAYELDASRLPNGRYTITAAATDKTGGATVSAPLSVIVDH